MGSAATAILRRSTAGPRLAGAAPAAPWLLAAALALGWLAFAPPTPDLAAQAYRAGLFDREGFTLFNANWYGGHHTPAYSILFPPLGALLGVRVVGALAAVASAVLFERIARRHFGTSAGARWGALWFGAGTAADLFIGRLTFAVGVTFGLAAVYALQRSHRRSGLALAAGCTLGSPVAGLFLAMAGLAHWLSTRARLGLAVAAAALVPAVGLALLFPEGGSQPYPLYTLLSVILSGGLLLRLLPRCERPLRIGIALYVAAALLAFAIPTPMGSNVSRLGAAFAGPLLLCAAFAPGVARRGHRRIVLVAVVPLLVWQWWAPVRETSKGAVDPSGQAAYFAPLLEFLDARADAAVRVEVPFTRLHWESVYVASRVPLARGWVTQLDVKYNPIFRTSAVKALTPERYRRWLAREGVRYVALPDVALDPTGRAEGALIRSGLPYLRPVHRARHWAIYEVLGTPGLTDGVGRLTKLAPESFDLAVRQPGFTLVRVRFTPYWQISRGHGCVMSSAAGWTLVYALRTGPLRVKTTFDPRRLVTRDARCTRVPAGARSGS